MQTFQIKARRIQFLNKKGEGNEEELSGEVESQPEIGDSEEKSKVEHVEKEQEENPRKGDFDFGYQKIDV